MILTSYLKFGKKYTEEMLTDVYMVGQYLDRADLRGRDLSGVNFSNATLRGADLEGANLRGAKFIKADLSRASLHMADCTGADFRGADMSMAYMKATLFKNADMRLSTIRCAIAKNALFIDADLRGMDFVNAFLLGARFDGSRLEGIRNADRAIFEYWLNPDTPGKPVYDYVEGWHRFTESMMGGVSVQDNAARRHGRGFK